MLVRLTCTCIAAMGDLAIEYGGDTRAKGFGMRRGRGARADGDGREEGRTDGRSVVFVVFVIHVNDARARSLLELGEEVYGGAKGVDEGVDVGGGVVKVEAGAGGAGNAEVAVEGLRAVVTAAAGDAGLVEEGAEVVGVDAVDVEGAEGGAAARGGRAVNGHLGEGGELLVEVSADLDLVVVNAVHANVGEVIARFAEGDGLGDGRCAGFESSGRFCVRALFEKHVGDHLAAAHPRGHRLQDVDVAPKETDTSRSAHFVPAADDPVHSQGLDVHLHVGQALACVEKHLGPDAARELDDFRHRSLSTGDVTHVRRRDELGLFVHQRSKLIHVQLLRILGEVDEFEHAPCALGKKLPRHDVRVVLQHAQYDFIPSIDVLRPPRVRHEIDRLARVSREHYFSIRLRVDEGGNLPSRQLVRIRRLTTQIMHPSMNVRVVVLVIEHVRVHDLIRLLGRRRVIQIHQPGPRLGDLVENREISSRLLSERRARPPDRSRGRSPDRGPSLALTIPRASPRRGRRRVRRARGNGRHASS